ncbi:MAG: ATP-binding protein, partial [Pseudomonadota bacterium]|nr:ATP-binding protein [Pseudomonadota bacterium]
VEHKQAEILQSQKRLERYQLFVQHEIKNIAQFIQLLTEQVVQLDQDADKVRLMDRLKSTMPVMAERASNTLQKMQQPLHEFYGSEQVDLATVIEEVLFMYELDADLSGNAQVMIARPVLLEVFKNILGNYRDHALTDQQIKINIQADAEQTAVVTIESVFVVKNSSLNSERLFEPFWTTSESGMGLGLFLTRELLKQVGSEIEFSHKDDKAVFTLRLNNVPDL